MIPPTLPPDASIPRVGTDIVPGLIGQLYDGKDFTRLKESRIVKRVHIIVNVNGIGEVPLSLSWKGLLNIPAGGLSASYQLTAQARRAKSSSTAMSSPPAPAGRTVTLSEGIHTIAIKVSHLSSAGGARQIIAVIGRPPERLASDAVHGVLALPQG